METYNMPQLNSLESLSFESVQKDRVIIYKDSSINVVSIDKVTLGPLLLDSIRRIETSTQPELDLLNGSVFREDHATQLDKKGYIRPKIGTRRLSQRLLTRQTLVQL